MKRQRLQHQADNLAQMACGWRVVGDLRRFAELQKGRIEINALTAEARFGGKPLGRLSLAEELAAWLAKDREQNGIPADYVSRAHVLLDFTTTTDAPGKALYLVRRAESVIETVARTYVGTFDKPEEPPYLL